MTTDLPLPVLRQMCEWLGFIPEMPNTRADRSYTTTTTPPSSWPRGR